MYLIIPLIRVYRICNSIFNIVYSMKGSNMDVYILNTAFEKIGVIDDAHSMVWTERLWNYGEFEMYTDINDTLLSLMQEDRYVQIPQSNKTMIIEAISIKHDAEQGNILVIRGRSLESIIDRRIVLQQTLMDGSAGSFQDGVETLLNENIINSSQYRRNVSNFVFQASTDPIITPLTLQAQYYAENIYDIVQVQCEKYGIGFQILLNASNQFVFSLYAGVDRSYDQTTNPYVIFSPAYDNLISSDFYRSILGMKTYALTFGDDSGAVPIPHSKEVFKGESQNAYQYLARRECKVDASDLSKYYQGTTTELPVADYLEQLAERGRLYLRENSDFTAFAAEAATESTSFVFGEDYFLGDTIQLEDAYGHAGTAMVIEVTISESPDGIRTNPIFKSL